MGDENDGQIALAVEPIDQVQDLGLHRDVERGGRLVGDQHFRLQGQCHGDHDALTHATGELVGVVAHPALGIGNADRTKQIDGADQGVFLGDVAMRADHLGDLGADAIDGVQRAHRILEDHGDLFAADVFAADRRSSPFSSLPR